MLSTQNNQIKLKNTDSIVQNNEDNEINAAVLEAQLTAIFNIFDNDNDNQTGKWRSFNSLIWLC